MPTYINPIERVARREQLKASAAAIECGFDPIHLLHGIDEHDTSFVRECLNRFLEEDHAALLMEYSRQPSRRERNLWLLNKTEAEGKDEGFLDKVRFYAAQVPKMFERIVTDRLSRMKKAEAEELVIKLLYKEHANKIEPFYKGTAINRVNLRGEVFEDQPRVANTRLVNMSHVDISIEAEAEQRRLISNAKAKDGVIKHRRTVNATAIRTIYEIEVSDGIRVLNSGEDRKLKTEKIMTGGKLGFFCPDLELFAAVSELKFSYDHKVKPQQLKPEESALLQVPTKRQLTGRMTKTARQTADEYAHILKLVGKGSKQKKTCAANVSSRIKQVERQKTWTTGTTAVNPETNEVISMADIVSATFKRRKGEVYGVALGIEKLAEAEGLQLCFAVLTCPPRFHANPKKSGNGSKWDGSLGDDSHRFLVKKWNKIRDKLRLRHEIKLTGIWTSETHDDGCAHLNVIYYYNAADKTTIERIIKSEFDWHKNAYKLSDGEGMKFSLYALKYALKSLSQDGVVTTDDAWYSTYCVRRYQFFGIPSLCSWRSLRLLKEAPEGNELILSLWRAARRGDYAHFMALNGGLGVERKLRPVSANQASAGGIKTTTIKLWKESIYIHHKKCWQIKSTPFKPNKDGLLGVILNDSKKGKSKDQKQSEAVKIVVPHLWFDIEKEPNLITNRTKESFNTVFNKTQEEWMKNAGIKTEWHKLDA